MLATRTAHPALAGSAAAAGVAAGAAAVASPGLTISVIATSLVIAVATRLSPQALVVGAIAYLPFEGFVTSHVHGSSLVWVRYGPEVMLAVVGLTVLAGNLRRIDRVMGSALLLVLVTLSAWAVSAAANGVGATTYVLGVRAEFRYLPLLLIMALSRNPARDTRRLGRIVVATAGVQALIGLAELIGGVAVRQLFAQRFSVDIGGVTVAHSTAVKLTSITGTMRTYNELSALLVLGLAVLVAAGPRRLGIPTALGRALAVLMPIVVIASGSREGAFAVAIVLAVALRERMRLPVLRVVVVVAVVSVIALPWLVVSPSADQHSSAITTRVREKWAQLLSPATWSGQYNAKNFRLYLSANEVQRVADTAPMLGFGTGSIVDPRTVANGSNPLLGFLAGRLAIEQGFVYDGNWSLLLMETGFVGLACVFGLLAWMAAVGGRLRHDHWIGQWLLTAALVVFELGFFAPVLQQHAPSAMLWSLTGAAIALAANGRSVRHSAALR